MTRIDVKLKSTIDNSYTILIKAGILNELVEDLVQNPLGFSYAIITDSKVKKLYGSKLKTLLLQHISNVLLIDFPMGEKQKNRDIKARIEDNMFEVGFGRDSAIIALGGGVVGDIAGFVASTYTRGIPYIQVPTTLVACVDSSIGGKTAVDTKHGKNLVGTFHQPKRVYIDINTLKTLEPKEIREGAAEIIKYAVIADEYLFNVLEKNINKLFEFNENFLSETIMRCCRIKSRVIEEDEKETNLRKILNFGHTIGHSIEKLSDYKLSHGNAISIGMALEGKIAVELELWDKNDLTRLEFLLKRAGLPTKIPFSARIDELIENMKIDKKSRGGHIQMVLPSAIGKMSRKDEEYSIKIDGAAIKNLFNRNRVNL